MRDAFKLLAASIALLLTIFLGIVAISYVAHAQVIPAQNQITATPYGGILYATSSATNAKIYQLIGSSFGQLVYWNGYVWSTIATSSLGLNASSVATSSSETSSYIPFWTSTGATPATLSGGSANLTFNGTTFATKYASTTAISASGQIYATGGNAVGSPNFCLTSACTTGLYSNGGNVALTTSSTGVTWGALSGVTSWYPNTDNVRNLGGASNRWLDYWGSGTATTSTLYITGLTAGSVPFINSLGLVSQDNANFFWDSANARLGIATSTPQSAFVIGNSWGRNVSCTSTTGTCTFTNGNNSLSRTVVVSNPSTSVIGNGGGVLFTLASGGATAINAGALDIVNENATFANNANGDSSMVFQTALNGSISERMRLTSNGWLGISTTSPFTNLSVGGNAYIGGNLTATGTAIISGNLTVDTSTLYVDAANDVAAVGSSSPSSACKFTVYVSGGRYQCIATNARNEFYNNDNQVSPNISLNNTQESAGFGAAVLFKLGYGGTASLQGTAINAGRVAAVADTVWDATAANQDAYIQIAATTDGAMTDTARFRAVVTDGSAANLMLIGSREAITTGEVIGSIDMTSNDTNITPTPGAVVASIRSLASGTHTALSQPTDLAFFTTAAGGTATNTEKMRLTGAGTLGLGTTTPNANSLLSLAGSAYVGGNLTATGTITFTGLSNGCLQSTSGVISSTGSACGGSSSVVGTIATSSAETSGRIPFYTSTGAYPALLSGGASGFTWDNSGSKLTATNASTTALSSGYASSTEARFGGLYLPNSKPTSTSTPLSIDSNGQVRSTVIATSTTPFSLTTSAGQSVFVIAKGNCADSSTEQEAQLSYNSVVVDTVKIDGDANANGAYALTWVGFPGAATADIAVACTVTAAENTKITVFKY